MATMKFDFMKEKYVTRSITCTSIKITLFDMVSHTMDTCRKTYPFEIKDRNDALLFARTMVETPTIKVLDVDDIETFSVKYKLSYTDFIKYGTIAKDDENTEEE